MATPVQAAPSQKSSSCNARRPILTAEESVIGYELFFRESPEQRNFSPANENVLPACQRLKQAGYAIVLDNFVPDDKREALVPYARNTRY